MKKIASPSRFNKRVNAFRRINRRRSLLDGFERLEERRLLAVFELFDGVTAPALPASWTQTTTSSNPWSTVATGSDTAPNHAFVANLPSISDSILTSPSFVLSPATPRLGFRNSYDTEQDWDGGVLEIAINGGAFSDILTEGGSFVSGGYVSTLQSGNAGPLAGRQA